MQAPADGDSPNQPDLLDNLGDNTGADGPAALADGET
jgi:hypothetical protein